MPPGEDLLFQSWFRALQDRHLSELSFREVRRAVQALSSWYVERRHRLRRGSPSIALDGRGKRAAFSLYYGPLHFLTIHHIVKRLGAANQPVLSLWDLGCGSGVGGVAWALRFRTPRPRVLGLDKSVWAVNEARWTLGWFNIGGAAARRDLSRVRLPGRNAAILASFVANELASDLRDRLLQRLLDAHARGAHVLVVEPVARRIVPWWDAWTESATARGGRADVWRFATHLPERLRLLDRAAGLDHTEMTARSVYLFPARPHSHQPL